MKFFNSATIMVVIATLTTAMPIAVSDIKSRDVIGQIYMCDGLYFSGNCDYFDVKDGPIGQIGTGCISDSKYQSFGMPFDFNCMVWDGLDCHGDQYFWVQGLWGSADEVGFHPQSFSCGGPM
jgi:hypothetical protein